MNIVKHMLLCIVFSYANFLSEAQISNHLFEFQSDSVYQADLWLGDTSKFTIEGGQLRSNSDKINDTFSIATRVINRESFETSVDIQLQISTSSANYVDVYLWSDSNRFEKAQNACFVRIGGTKDAFYVYYVKAGELELMAQSSSGLTHSLLGSLSYFSIHDSLVKFQFRDSITKELLWIDTVVTQPQNAFGYIGMSVRQSTSSFHYKHHFDNLYYGPIRQDSIAPQLKNLRVVSDSILELAFDEEIDSTELKIDNFKLDESGTTPIQITYRNDTIWLKYGEGFGTGNYVLTVLKISDLGGNVTETLQIPFYHIVYGHASEHDIVISEIFSDYSPAVGLPEHEFIELTNRSKKIIDLSGWRLTDGSRVTVIPQYTLWPDSIVVICDDEALDDFEKLTNKLGVENLISLNNSSDSVWLTNSEGAGIHDVYYSSDWHFPDWKEYGGWSLEMIDLDKPCLREHNWASSTGRKGGTPGEQNSVRATLVDGKPPHLINVETGGKDVELTFDEPLSEEGLIVDDFLSENLSIVSVIRLDETRLRVTFKEQIDTGVLQFIDIYNVRDCLGNESDVIHLEFGIGKVPEPGDVIINEVMYDVTEDCEEYVELYNTSDELIDLRDLYFAVSDSEQHWRQLYKAQNKSQLLRPRAYAVFCEDTTNLKTCKAKAEHMIEVDKMPGLVNSSGNIAVVDARGNVINLVQYSDDLHFPLLSQTRDVSLERLNPTVYEKVWRSSTSTCNFGTPGYRNSQVSESNRTEGVLQIETDPVSPNLDGYNDQLRVRFHVDGEFIAHFRIYDLTGALVAFPANSSLISGETTFDWDCIGKNGSLVTSGIYIADIEAISLTGQKVRERMVFTVVR